MDNGSGRRPFRWRLSPTAETGVVWIALLHLIGDVTTGVVDTVLAPRSWPNVLVAAPLTLTALAVTHLYVVHRLRADDDDEPGAD